MRDHRKLCKTFSNKWIECPVSMDLSSLPVDIEIAFPLRKSFPFFLFGLGWTLAAFLLFARTSDGGPLVVIFSASVFAAGFAVLMRSLSYVGARLSVHLDKDVITIRDSSILRPGRPLQIPVKEMEGIVIRQIEEEIEDYTKYYQVIELLHGISKQAIPLYIQTETESPNQVLAEYSERLSLPVFRARTNMTDSLEPFEAKIC